MASCKHPFDYELRVHHAGGSSKVSNKGLSIPEPAQGYLPDGISSMFQSLHQFHRRGGMKQDLVVQTDIATLLGRLADELRGGSLAISGAVTRRAHEPFRG